MCPDISKGQSSKSPAHKDPLVPTIMSTNVRSAFLKLDSIATEIVEEKVDIAFLTEIWLDSDNHLQSNRLERLFELGGLETFATPRLGKKGGGVAIVVNTAGKYAAKKLHVNTATGRNSLETVWILLSPKQPGGLYKHFICCCLYSPPNTKLNDALVAHVQYNVNRLVDVYKGAAVVICGDVNSLRIERLESVFCDMKNIVADPTHGARVLDVIITDAHRHYDRAVVGPPINPDVPGLGKSSDHRVAIARPVANPAHITSFKKIEIRKRRVVTAASLLTLGVCLATYDWNAMYDAKGVDKKIELFNESLANVIDQFCPIKSTRVRLNDKFFVSAKCVELSEMKSREYRKNKNSQEFKRLRKAIKIEIQESN